MSGDVEARLREMLAERATQVSPTADVVDQVRTRAAATQRRRWTVPLIAAASVVVVLLGSVVGVQALRAHPRPAAQSPPPPSAASCERRGAVPSAFNPYLRTTPTSALITAQDLGSPFTPGQRPFIVSGIPGFSLVSTQASPLWQLSDRVWQFDTTAHAARGFTALLALEQCAPPATRFTPKGQIPPDTVFYQLSRADRRAQFSPQPEVFPASGFVVDTRIGRSIVSVLLTAHLTSVSATAPGSPPPAPSSRLFIALADAVRAKATGGVPAGHLPALPGSAAPTLPSDFLTLADLGAGWTVGTFPGDSETVSSQTTVGPGPSCGTPNLALAQTGHSQTYRSHQPLGDKEWLLTETVVQLTPQAVVQARAAMLHPCANFREVGLTPGTITDLTATPPGKTLGFASSYTLTANTLICLTTLPGGASGGNTANGPVPLPGGIQWLTTTTTQAISRTNGD